MLLHFNGIITSSRRRNLDLQDKVYPDFDTGRSKYGKSNDDLVAQELHHETFIVRGYSVIASPIDNGTSTSILVPFYQRNVQ